MNRKLLFSIFIIALLFRIALIPVARHGDINNNTTWGDLLIQRGPVNFYEGENWPHSAPNQPPLYILLFGFTTLLENTFSSVVHSLNNAVQAFPSGVIWWFEWWGELYIAKLPGIFADIGIAFLIYKFVTGKKGIILAALWLVNPISWYNSAIWGGTDSIVNLLGLTSLYFLLKQKNLVVASLVFVLSLLFKSSLMLFVPILIFIAVKQKHELVAWVKAGVVSALVVLLIAVPFHLNIDIFRYLLRLYTERFLPGEIGYLTANAFNFWWLVDPEKTLDSTVYFGLTARLWGFLITGGLYLFAVFTLLKKFSIKNILVAFSLAPFIFFLFMTRIHERYLYPFFPLATIALGYTKWLWIPYIILSGAHLLNLYHLFWAPGIPSVEKWYTNPQLMVVLSVINLAIFGYILLKSLRNQPKT